MSSAAQHQEGWPDPAERPREPATAGEADVAGHDAGRSGSPSSSRSDPLAQLTGWQAHSLHSMLELGHELTVVMDLFQTADLVLFNLMGHMGTSRSALWLMSEESPPAPVLLRCHGFSRPLLEPLGTVCQAGLTARFGQQPEVIPAASFGECLDPSASELVGFAGIALFAPLVARGEQLGWLALGPRVNGRDYQPSDLRVLEAALGMFGVSLQNVRLYNRMLESNRQLRASNEHLKELDRAKTEFISNVNHELRTPLAIVMGTLECVLDQNPSEPAPRKLLEAALARSHGLKQLIENLLAFSDAVRGRLPLRTVEADLGAVLGLFYTERAPGVTASLRQLVYDPEPDLPKARFDPQRARQILDELLDNALKFTPRGTLLRLGLRAVEDEGRSWLEVSLADTGPGIPAERMDSLFRAFEQVDGSATRRVGGLGMGLALARELAEQMHGTLTATSQVGGGTTFCLRLPAA